jgi:DNA-binding winged helix-turn-helix (wHTH) protein
MPESGTLVRLRFGVFEVDLRTRELRKHGVKVRLQEQPFQVLAMLLERSGEVVTREELRSRLWSADTFVDFDHGVNKAINRIRDAIGDSATSPRFIETVARRGYRFIGDVVVDQTGISQAESRGEDPARPTLSRGIPSRHPRCGAATRGGYGALPR